MRTSDSTAQPPNRTAAGATTVERPERPAPTTVEREATAVGRPTRTVERRAPATIERGATVERSSSTTVERAAATTVERGSAAERRATAMLTHAGYRIVETNFRCKVGELDIIARDGDTLVFVEVRSRHDAAFGSALDAVGARKQRQVSRVAALYLAWRRPRFEHARFDVVAITGEEVVHIRDAWRL